MKRYAAKPTASGAKAALLEIGLDDTLTSHNYAATHAINTTRQMYRDPATYRSPMYDRRIVRGSTVMRRVDAMAGETRTARETQAKKRALFKQLEAEKKSREVMLRARLGCDPAVVTKREHEPVDLRIHLEEIVDKEPEVETVDTMVDLFLDRPETPPYVPAKTGLEASTQIDPGDLWDYDREVWPILEVLVGKTTEQALIEVIQEEEIATIYEQQRKYIEMRLAEEAEKNRLIEQERRLCEEKERRVGEFHKAVALQKETEERIAAAVFAHGYIADLLPNVLEGLKMAGYLLDDIKEFVEMDFIPGLCGDEESKLGGQVTVHDILTMIVREIQETNAAVYKELGEKYIPPKPFIPAEVQSQVELEEEPSEVYSTEILDMGMEEDLLPPVEETYAVTGTRLVKVPPEVGYKTWFELESLANQSANTGEQPPTAEESHHQSEAPSNTPNYREDGSVPSTPESST